MGSTAPQPAPPQAEPRTLSFRDRTALRLALPRYEARLHCRADCLVLLHGVRVLEGATCLADCTLELLLDRVTVRLDSLMLDRARALLLLSRAVLGFL
jgi:hypothetical protein